MSTCPFHDFFLNFIALFLLLGPTCNGETKPTIFIDIGLNSTAPTQQIKFAVQVCVGLANRNDKIIGPAYTLQGINDLKWLQNTRNGNGREKKTTTSDFLKLCYKYLAAGWLRYNYTAQKIIIPNIVTLAAVEDATPCLLYTSPSPRDRTRSRMPSSA